MLLSVKRFTPSLTSLLIIIAGILTTLSFAPFHIYPLAIIGVAFLLNTLDNISSKKAFYQGWIYGLGFFSTGVYWIFISLNTFGHINTLIALPMTASFIAFLACYPAISCYLLNRYFPSGNVIRFLLAFPAIWTITEWFRSILFTGFPWLIIGYSQQLSPLRGYATIGGVLGVSLTIILSAGLSLKAIKDYNAKNYYAMWAELMGLALLWSIGAVLAFTIWTYPAGKPLKVSLVQGNIPQNMKWSEDMVKPTLNIYKKLSEPHWDSDIVIWPESAIPDFLDSQEKLLNKLDNIAKKHHTSFITGIPIRLFNNTRYYNGVIALGEGSGYYLKHRLVPFGEYIPFKKFFAHALNILNIPLADFQPDTKPAKPIKSGSIKIYTAICYEVAFPELLRFHDPSIGLMLTINNDAWFGHSTAQSQHLEMAVMRAIESGRPMLFVSNDGPTAIINARGQITAIAPNHVATVLTGTVQPAKGKTPWLLVGFDPLLILLFFMLFKAWRIKKSTAKL